MAEEQVNQIARFWILAKCFWTIGFVLQDQLCLFVIEFSWGHVLRQVRLDQLLFSVVTNAFGFEISAVSPDPDHARQAFEVDRA